MPRYDLIVESVPDYMHGLRLGLTKTMLYKWFSASNSKKPYFIGKQIKNISKRLCAIHPPDYIERLPRDLEKNYAHFRATELQAFLLYYAIPCLTGYLPDPYLSHSSKLSEATYILLGDSITMDEIDHASKLLDEYYRDFANLYGEGSCGLNVHNAGVHVVDYGKTVGSSMGLDLLL